MSTLNKPLYFLALCVTISFMCLSLAHEHPEDSIANTAIRLPLPSHSPVPLRCAQSSSEQRCRYKRVSTGIWNLRGSRKRRGQYRAYWCGCRRRCVTDEGACYPCPYPHPSTSPTPTPTNLLFSCTCNGTTFSIEQSRQSEDCPGEKGCTMVGGTFGAVHGAHCSCLGRRVLDHRRCCNCQKTKCKCWHPWWRAKKYRRHRCFGRCVRRC